MKATPRKHKIVIERKAVTGDEYGGEVETWAPYLTCYARVFYGSGKEQREAAQLQASLPATFEVMSSEKSRSVAETDRIQFKGETWGISAPPNELEFNEGVRLHAVRL